MIEVDQKLSYNQKFLTAVKKIRTNFEMPKRESMTLRERIGFTENPELIAKSKELAEQFKLPQSWAETILSYIVYGEFLPLFAPDIMSLRIEQEDEDSEKEFYLRIFPHTSKRDLLRHLRGREIQETERRHSEPPCLLRMH